MTVPAELPTSGRIPYTERAALQDASLAMGKDVVRGIVELVTNCSDSYGNLERAGLPIGDGRIDILVERRREDLSRIVVRDHAEGMTAETLYNSVLQAGERRGGVGARGFMGRGAKDAAYFGGAIFESIKDGAYTTAQITPGMDFKDRTDRSAGGGDYRRLGLPTGTNGTQATMLVDRSRYSIARHEGLLRRLTRNVQLRGILTNPKRDVVVADLARLDRAPAHITFQFPVATTLEKSVRLVIPGYPEAQGTLEIRRCAELLEDDRGAERISGIVISDETAYHEATYFGLEGRSGALRFAGDLICPYIRTLQEAFDDPASGLGARNPVPIVTRTRAGLNREHPFVEALAAFVDKQFRPLVEKEEEAQSVKGGQETNDTRDRLRKAARELGRRFLEETRKLELEIQNRGTDDGPTNEPVPLKVIPGRVFLQPEETTTFTVQSWPAAFTVPPDPWVATVHIDDEEVASLSATEVVLEPDTRVPERRRGTFQITAGTREDATLVEVRLGDVAEAVIVEVAATKPLPPVEPTRLIFAQAAYRVRPNRPKTIILMAPTSLVETAGVTVTLTSTHDQIQFPETVELQICTAEDNSSKSWYEAEFEITVASGVQGRVRAALGGQAATCSVHSSEHESQNPFEFQIAPVEPRYPGQGRAKWIYPKGVRTLQILARQNSLSPYFGEKMEKQGEIPCRMLIAEILASEIALFCLAEADKQARGELSRDAETYSFKFRELTTTFLSVAHQVLVPEISGKS